jgi:excisionase family DNA binding protein
MPQELETIVPEANDMRLVSRRHAAQLMDCSPEQVSNLIHRGDLDAIRIGARGVRITLTSLKRFIDYPNR